MPAVLGRLGRGYVELRNGTVRKGVWATPRAWIWPVYRGQNRPNRTVSVLCAAPFRVPAGLFGRFRDAVLRSSAKGGSPKFGATFRLVCLRGPHWTWPRQKAVMGRRFGDVTPRVKGFCRAGRGFYSVSKIRCLYLARPCALPQPGCGEPSPKPLPTPTAPLPP
jgi:hypothetical protein